MKGDRFKINTIKDILDCVTEDNIDTFLSDFEGWLRVASPLYQIVKSVSDENKYTDGTIDLSFTWIDDDKKEIKITLQAKQNE